jgi:hypothetical protein
MNIQERLTEITHAVCKKEDAYFVKDINEQPVLVIPFVLIGEKQHETLGVVSVSLNKIWLSLGHRSNPHIACALCKENQTYVCSYEENKDEMINYIKQTESFQQVIQYFRINAALKGLNVHSLLLQKGDH